MAASGGILASSVLVATTQPQTDLQAAMAALEPVVGPDATVAGPPAADTTHRAETFQVATETLSRAASAVALPVTTDAAALPGTVETVSQPLDRPAQAVAAPADAENAAVGELGFVGVTPVVEEPEVVETEVSAAAEARSETTASRSESRSAAPAASTPEPEAAPAPAPEPEPEPEPAPAPSGGAEGAIGWAYNHLGLPYSYGSDSGGGYDCSGFVRAAYRSVGVSLPHGSSAQYSATSRVSLDSIQRGDLLFYSNGGGIYHVAIYLGGGEVIHSLRDGSSFSGSKVTSMYYSPGLFAAGRP
ncbi:MAG: C40 family peptidase [Actinomycetales bacterium]|nr:C40 family peptidase [Actinomycetales bacterium]